MSFLGSLRGHGALPFESTACYNVHYWFYSFSLLWCAKAIQPQKCFWKMLPQDSLCILLNWRAHPHHGWDCLRDTLWHPALSSIGPELAPFPPFVPVFSIMATNPRTSCITNWAVASLSQRLSAITLHLVLTPEVLLGSIQAWQSRKELHELGWRWFSSWKAVIFTIKLHTIPLNNQCLGGNTHI